MTVWSEAAALAPCPILQLPICDMSPGLAAYASASSGQSLLFDEEPTEYHTKAKQTLSQFQQNPTALWMVECLQ